MSTRVVWKKTPKGKIICPECDGLMDRNGVGVIFYCHDCGCCFERSELERMSEATEE